MSEAASNNYQIKIGVDGRPAARGVKTFTGSLNESLKVLKEFDRRAQGTFAGLAKLARNDIAALDRKFRGTAKAIETLNRVKISKALISNLQALQNALKLKVNVSALKLIPDAIAALSRVRVDGNVVRTLEQLKAAMIGWKSPPVAAVRNISALATALDRVNPSRISASAAALQRLNGLSIRAGRLSLDPSRIRTFRTELTQTAGAANLLRTALAGVSTVSLIAGGRGIFQTGSAFQNLERTLGAVATSQAEVREQLDFVRSLATRLPISLEAIAQSYGKFSVAARLAGVSAADTQKVFSGFATAFAAMGVSTDAQERAFLALEQIFSKGKISAEEWRLQMSDALPGAMSLLSESLGVSTARLSEMMSQGEVTSDALLGVANLLQTRFGTAVNSAMSRGQAQITEVQNALTRLRTIIFSSGFESGLGAMAKQMAEVLNSDKAKTFAADIGQALGTAFKAVGALAKVMADNHQTVVLFFKVFAGYAVIASAGMALRLLAMPLGLIASLAATAGNAFRALRGAIVLLAAGKALDAISSLGKAFSGLSGKIMASSAAVLLLAYGMDQLLNSGAATESLLNGINTALQAGMGVFGTFGDELGRGMSKAFGDAMKEADKFAAQIEKTELTNRNAIEENGKREQANAAAKAKALSEAEAELWKQVSPIGAANVEYQKQLALLDSIASKTGADVSGAKATLTAQTLDDREPIGALVRDYKLELAAMKAKTGEQQAINRALETQNDLVKKGITLTDTQAQALKDYQLGIARMNGEIGNGIERWTASVGDWNDQMAEAIKDGIDGLSDELTNFLTGAESDCPSSEHLALMAA